MSPVHGRDITAGQVELIVGRDFPVQRFVSMCNAILWALSRPAGLAQVSLTERVFVADNGVDAELVLEIPHYTAPPGSLLLPGDAVVQYKQRDITARDRNRIVGDLRRDLRCAARKVSELTGGPRNQYLLLTNVSLSIDEKQELEEAISEGVPDIRVQVSGAAEIAATSKLVQTVADKRILFLERQNMNLFPKSMLDEVDKQKPAFPDLALVDEIWILETMFYERDLYLRFERFDNGALVGSLDFQRAELLDKFENGVLVLGSSPPPKVPRSALLKSRAAGKSL